SPARAVDVKTTAGRPPLATPAAPCSYSSCAYALLPDVRFVILFVLQLARGNMAPHQNPLSPSRRILQAVLLRVRPAIVAEFLKRALGSERIVVSTPHGRFWVDPMSQLGGHLTRYGSFDADVQSSIEKFLPIGGTFVDLGANEGYFTVLGAKKIG